MKCKQCGGNVTKLQHSVYRTDGSTSGTYHCQGCGRTIGWVNKGYQKQEVIDMGD